MAVDINVAISVVSAINIAITIPQAAIPVFTPVNILRPDGVTVITTKDDGESYITDPSIFTCQELNDDLTQAQRDVIHQIILNKTGQTVSFATGDDGDLEEGRSVDFFTLNCNNSFGNTDRFTDSVGGQDYDGTGGSLVDYVIDNSTSLAWYRIQQGTATWSAAISAANAATFAGFSDWRMSNDIELTDLMNRGTIRPLNYAPFLLGGGAAARILYFTSTTLPGATTFVLAPIINHTITGIIHRTNEILKTSSENYIVCRNHF